MTRAMAQPSNKPSTPKLPPSLTAKQQGNIASDDSKTRLKDFLEKRAKKVLRG